MPPTEIKKLIDLRYADYMVAVRSIKSVRTALSSEKEKLLLLKEAQTIAQTIAKAVQQQTQEQVARVVSRCLEMVFDEPYEFVIHFEQKRNRTEASLLFKRNGLEVDPMTASGGGVVDVAAFALRLSCLLMAKPPVRRFMALDEPFRFVSVEYRPRVAAMLELLSKEMGVQFLIVTHMPEFNVGKIIQL